MSSGPTRNHTGPGASAPTAGPAALPVTAPRSPSSNDQEDPFAPPPEGVPDRPWQPRTPPVREGDTEQGDDGGDQDGPRSGSPWSDQQPGRQGNGFGRLGGSGGGRPGGSRFDITDPVQRRARYGLLAGMWGFFFALFGVPEIALLLGALALHWGISSLRGRTRMASGAHTVTAPAPAGIAGQNGRAARPQFLPAVSGIAAGGIALVMVLGNFATQMVYKEYFDCVSDALTSKARESCAEHMPDWLEPWAKMRD